MYIPKVSPSSTSLIAIFPTQLPAGDVSPAKLSFENCQRKADFLFTIIIPPPENAKCIFFRILVEGVNHQPKCGGCGKLHQSFH